MRWFRRLPLVFAAVTSFAGANTPVQNDILFSTDVAPAIRFIQGGGTTFDNSVVYTGASLSMDVDATGKWTYKPNNLAVQSNTPSNAAWTKTNGSITATGVSDPFGGNNASTFTASAGAALVYQVLGAQAGVRYMSTIWVKRRTGSGAVRLYAADGSTFNVIAVDNTWQQFYIVGTTAGSANAPLVYLVTNGDAVDIYGGMMSAVTYETTPRPADQTITTASAYYGQRWGYDPVNIGTALGYGSYEQRTKLALWSNTFSNAAWVLFGSGTSKVGAGGTGPDGLTAFEVALGTTGGTIGSASCIYQALSFTSGTTYAGTMFVQAKSGTTSVRLALDDGATTTGTSDITVNSTSWTRIPLVVAAGHTGTGSISLRTNTAGNSTNVYVAYGELEATSANYPGPTPPMATAGSTVTVAADVASITGSAFNFYNQSQGAFVATATPAGDYNEDGFVFIAGAGGTTLNGIRRVNSATSGIGKRWVGQILVGGINQALLPTSADSFATAKLALSYQISGAALAADGVIAATAVPGSLPTGVNQLFIGSYYGTANWLDGHIKQLDYYTPKPQNAKLIRLPLLDLPRIPANDDQPERMAA